MSEKYYVVSERELCALRHDTANYIGSIYEHEDDIDADLAVLEATEDACRVRPVTAVPGRSTSGEGICWIEEEV